MKKLNRLITLIKRLRHPVGGCPWDRKQNPDSIKEYLIEEAYELKSAIDQGSATGQREEAGDLLLQILLLARMHQERGHFDFGDIVDTLTEKLVSRHPHIFQNAHCADASEVRAQWEQIKKQEKNKNSILSRYPADMPALLVAKRIGEQAASIGFDWETPRRALGKVREEIREVEEALARQDTLSLGEEIGDLLFAVVNVARLLDINPESALSRANDKFRKRFSHIEKDVLCHPDRTYTLEDLENLWREAKGASGPGRKPDRE